MPSDRHIYYNNAIAAPGYDIWDAESYLHRDGTEYMKEWSNLENICTGNICDYTALTVIKNIPKPSLYNGLQDIESKFDQRATADNDITPTSLVDHIWKENVLINVSVHKDRRWKGAKDFDINPSSLLE